MSTYISSTTIGLSAGFGVMAIAYLISRRLHQKYEGEEDYVNIHSTDNSFSCNNTVSCEKMSSFTNSSSRTHVFLSSELIHWIKATGLSVLEMCAGNGSNAQALIENGVPCVAFDMFPRNDTCMKFDNNGDVCGEEPNPNRVRFGLAGTVEDEYPDHILLIISGFECKKSIKAYTGKTVILGSPLKRIPSDYVEVDFITDPRYPDRAETVKLLKTNLYSAQEDNAYISYSNPSIEWMKKNGWRMEKFFCGIDCIFTIWSRLTIEDRFEEYR